MPKIEAKMIQKELEQGWVWPVYWIYGSERMKAREVFRRIRKRVLGEVQGLGAFAEESFDGGEAEAAAIVDAAMSPSLGGGCRLVVVRDAHALKNVEELSALLGPKAKIDEGAAALGSVCVCFSKDLDARKKFSKLLIEKAAVVACEVLENERGDWIDYLAKRRNLSLAPVVLTRLIALDPWSLDIVDQELEKISLSTIGEGLTEDSLGGAVGAGEFGSDSFIEYFFGRRLKESLRCLDAFADKADESIPLVGLMAWNLRHLALILTDKESGRRSNLRMNPYALEKLNRWSRQWTLTEVLKLQTELTGMDYSLKQTPILPLGAWTELVIRYCK